MRDAVRRKPQPTRQRGEQRVYGLMCRASFARYMAVTNSVSRMSAENSGQGVNANRLVMDILSARL